MELTHTTPQNNSMTNYIDKDELIPVAQAVDCMEYLIQDIIEEYFLKFNSNHKDEHWCIIHEFNRNRARIEMLSMLILDLEKELKKNKITCYNE